VECKNLESRRQIRKLKKDMQKNKVTVLGVSEVSWNGQGEIRGGGNTVY